MARSIRTFCGKTRDFRSTPQVFRLITGKPEVHGWTPHFSGFGRLGQCCWKGNNSGIVWQWGMLHPNAKVLAMFAFDSYSQSKRSPRPLSRHRPCKTPFPIGNATFNKLPRFYLKWVFLINSQWNAGFIQPFLPRTAESASSPSIVATATAEPGSPTNFAPISFSAWNSAHTGPEKSQPKKIQQQAETIRNQQKPAAAATAAAGRIE